MPDDRSLFADATRRVRRVADVHPGERIPAATARALLRCRPQDIDELVALGWSTGTGPHGVPLFDGDEIRTIGLRSGSGRSLPELGSGMIAALARRTAAELTGARRWSVVATAASRGPDGARIAPVDDSATVNGWTGWQPDPDVRTARARWRGEGTITGEVVAVRDPVVGRAYDQVLGDFDYQYLPPAAARDTALLERLRIVDCAGAAHLLAAWLRPHGIDVRVRCGLLMVPMGTGTHSWAEITGDDGRTARLDPTLVMMTEQPAGAPLGALVRGSALNVVLPFTAATADTDVVALTATAEPVG